MICFAISTVLILVLGISWRWENYRRDQLYGSPPIRTSDRDSETPTANTPPDSKDGAQVEVQPTCANAAERYDWTDLQNPHFRYVY